MNHLNFPVLGPRGAIAFFGLFHLSVAALAIGLAFLVTTLEIIGYRRRIRRYDLFAKRIQLFHVCIYNVGTINAIGLIFALSGLFPQFWTQLFDQFFWPLMIEEFLFFLLATTLTFHYFFWEKMWGHKILHILLGLLLVPFFFLQIYIINGLGGFMLTPGQEEGAVSLFKGVLGWDFAAMYNPSFLMLQMHRTFANISYAGFFMAGWCGFRLFTTRDQVRRDYYEDCGNIVFFIAFAAFLSLPVVGYFYSHVLMNSSQEAFMNLMIGRGDIVLRGIDLWWIKHVFVAMMLGGSLLYFLRLDRKDRPVWIPGFLVYGVAAFYLMFYVAMGMVMTWAFFWWMLISSVAGAIIAIMLLLGRNANGRGLFIYMGVLSFLTVMLGGYAREASRPRFVDRISHYNDIYVPGERQQYLLLPEVPAGMEAGPSTADAAEAPESTGGDPAAMIREKCAVCHTLNIVRNYKKDDWADVVERMRKYGSEMTDEEAALIVDHLQAGGSY